MPITDEKIEELEKEIAELRELIKTHSHNGMGSKMIKEIIKLSPLGLTTTYTDKNNYTITVRNGIII